jgi:hypothetical protein
MVKQPPEHDLDVEQQAHLRALRSADEQPDHLLIHILIHILIEGRIYLTRCELKRDANQSPTAPQPSRGSTGG